MGKITVDPKGVFKLLYKLKIHKASWSGGLSARVLRECRSEIAPILALINNESLAQGTAGPELEGALGHVPPPPLALRRPASELFFFIRVLLFSLFFYVQGTKLKKKLICN